jgi:hypothetical protein
MDLLEQYRPVELTPGEAAVILATTPSVLQAEFTALPEPLLRWRMGRDGWCALEVVGHLIEAEQRGFAGRLRQILAEPRPAFDGWDPTEIARCRRDGERDPQSILDEFASLRAESVALVSSLTFSDLDRGGDHPDVGYLTVRDLLHEWVQHDAAHLNQIRENVQHYVWPYMGNAQRFSRPEIAETVVPVEHR